AHVDVRVVDDDHREPLALEPPDAQEVGGVDVVRRPRVARVADRVASVQLVLDVAAADQPPVVTAGEDDPARLVRLFPARLGAAGISLRQAQDPPAPPASAGMMATSSPSSSRVSLPSIASLLT